MKYDFTITGMGLGDKLLEFLQESDKIEGMTWDIGRARDKFQAAIEFLNLSEIRVDDVCNIVNIFQPGAVLRDKPGLDVRVGNHIAPRGGPEIRGQLSKIINPYTEKRDKRWENPWKSHVEYETLHPFTDGNGRSGRLFWAWQMLKKHGPSALNLGFLHMFYYQTLENQR